MKARPQAPPKVPTFRLSKKVTKAKARSIALRLHALACDLEELFK